MWKHSKEIVCLDYCFPHGMTQPWRSWGQILGHTVGSLAKCVRSIHRHPSGLEEVFAQPQLSLSILHKKVIFESKHSEWLYDYNIGHPCLMS